MLGRRLNLGVLTALGTVLGVVVVLAARGPGMFSPGALSVKAKPSATLGGVASHAELSGQCSACHVAPWARPTMESRCLDCHSDIRAQIDRRGPIHGTMTNGTACRDCHTEHRGAHAAITDFAAFDHDWCDFQLTGRHQGVECRLCHTTPTYKGTPQTCVGCHSGPKGHKEQFGTNCASCHTTSGWAGASFDHDQCAFPLTGRHRAVSCRSCHTGGIYKGTPQTCVGCHSGPKGHKEQFGTNCASCHTTTTWSDATFQHRFPVNHAKAQQKGGCAICHDKPGQYSTYTCSNCHKHELTNTAKKHLKFGVADVSGCATCHPQGKKKKLALEASTLGELCGACGDDLPWFGELDRIRTAVATPRSPLIHSTRPIAVPVPTPQRWQWRVTTTLEFRSLELVLD